MFRSHKTMMLSKLAIALSVLGIAVPSFAEVKIAVVNARRVMEECKEGKGIVAKLKAEAEKKQKEFEGKRKELEAQEADLAKNQSILTPDAFQKKRAEFAQKVAQLQESAAKAQQEFANKEASMSKPLMERILKVIASLGQEGKYTMILQKDAVLWPEQSENDLTNEVIRKVDAGGK